MLLSKIMSEQQPAVLEIPPIEYSLNFEWGSFTTTKLAHELYGLTPFRGETLPKEVEGEKMVAPQGHKIDVMLAVPGEMGIPDVEVMNQYINSTWNDKGLSIVTAFGGGKEIITEVIS